MFCLPGARRHSKTYSRLWLIVVLLLEGMRGEARWIDLKALQPAFIPGLRNIGQVNLGQGRPGAAASRVTLGQVSSGWAVARKHRRGIYGPD
ncbi:protein of unknown function [Methylocaldum szegediense]|uniref:Uncharacterized protein n=1 Tax=Methylocaldum szegediense TaxID=73780 RepID=A0ABM9HW69_9GAMM|nr:protein of unknown function [Methylocaldum szegediense]